MGAYEPRIDGKLVEKGAPTGLKNGVMTTAHSHTTFQCNCFFFCFCFFFFWGQKRTILDEHYL